MLYAGFEPALSNKNASLKNYTFNHSNQYMTFFYFVNFIYSLNVNSRYKCIFKIARCEYFARKLSNVHKYHSLCN